ncbi:MAG: hypothetical protein E7372_02240 [Clostridiales bacterium]|nr:hypothetical protein [Clostridiales bacterium]
MKNITARKIVLYSVALLSAIMLIVGLSFSVTFLSLSGEKEGVSGFELLAFKFPEEFRLFIISVCNDKAFIEFYEVFFGITSLLTLVLSIVSIGLMILAFFKFDKKKEEITSIILLAVSLLVSIGYAVLPVFFNREISLSIKRLAEQMSGTGYDEIFKHMTTGTSAFISAIIQAVIFVGYIVCLIVFKEKKASKKGTIEKAKQKHRDLEVDKVFSFEYSIIELLKEYKNLHNEGVITQEEYFNKKEEVLNSSNEKIKEISSLIKNIPFEEVIKTRKIAVEVLREYKKLLESQTILENEYDAKKEALLYCVID